MTSKLLAFHLPQYHPIPENDQWWGPGFTEWRNVTRAKPLFPGHYQPHVPADLGYYDLRLPEVRYQQASLALQYGIYGFCYYHYWFSGRQLLERPVAEILSSGEPDFPFCLCWANENWTRRWDGMDQEILIAQNYSRLDDEIHLLSLIPYFKDPRYIKIGNKPLFLVYRVSHLPSPSSTAETWRAIAKQHGFDDLYLVKVESSPTELEQHPDKDGFNASLDFQPDWGGGYFPYPFKPSRREAFLRNFGLTGPFRYGTNAVYTYPEVVDAMINRPHVNYPRFPCVTPGWDNSSRRPNGQASIIVNSTPSLYGKWLRAVLEDTYTLQSLPEPIVFINAWNEWGEGNHLEPDLRWGHAYLQETLKSVGN